MNRQLGILLLLLMLFSLGSSAGETLLVPLLDEPEATATEIALLPESPLGSLPSLTSPKIQSFLKEEAERLGSGTLPLLVQLESPLTSSQRSELLELGSALKYEYQLLPALAVSIDIQRLDDLAALPFVKAVEYDADTKVVLAQSTLQIGARRVWLSHGVEGEGITVAILDTGIDNEHPDVQNVIAEQDFTGEGTDDGNGHGTHVASIVAGTGAASGGVNKGVAAKASLLDVKVLDKTGSGKLSDAIAGIEWAVLNNADIISMSLGAFLPCNGLDTTSLAADLAVKRGKHVVVAAGNLGPLPGTITSPGCAREVITVGAVDRLDTIALFSSRGPTLDGWAKPDIVAPGVLILAAQAGGSYVPMSGTSMAAPHISGVVALLLSQKPGLSPDQVKEALMTTALDLGEGQNTQGAGRVQAYEAFIKATGLQPQEPSAEEAPPEEEKKEEAERKSQESGHIDTVKSVREKEQQGKEYYVVEGTKEGNNKIIRVWVDQETGEIERVEEMGILYWVWASLRDFLEWVRTMLSSFFSG
ncbi:MAG: S8 family serine peptidase [Nanoarchaeota archaeon]|nr:S8 family serine peptidase [Nanoarchaeota archaeon]